MRAMCGAIITAGALIGLGLLGIGVGIRYSQYTYINIQTDQPQWIYIKYMDTALLIALYALVGSLIIGLAIAFMGLAYHHHRRHLEYLHRYHQGSQPRGAPTVTTERTNP
jgi:hypothetical protein